MTSRVSGLMSERVNMSPKSLYLPACSISTLTPILSSVFLKYIISARRPLTITGSDGTQIDAVRAGRNVILARSRLAQVGEHRLAGFLELIDIEPQLLRAWPILPRGLPAAARLP